MSRFRRVALTVVYWVAVIAISVVLLVLLITLIESRDKSSVDDQRGGVVAPALSGR